jgi:hypothetical protein
MRINWDRVGGSSRGDTRVLVFTEHVNATYYISFEGPLSGLARVKSLGWWVISSTTVARILADTPLDALLLHIMNEARPTCVVLTRYAQPAGPVILRFFRHHGVRCVYHLDDDLLGLSAELGADVLARHGRPDVVMARRELIADADLVYASTPVLVDALKQRYPKQSFVTGIYRSYDPSIIPEVPTQLPVLIGYMGSKGHAQDLEIVVPALRRLLEKYGDAIRFELFGTIPFPDALASFASRIRHHKATADYVQFMDRLRRLQWHIGLAPLADNTFNRCKSPTKFIEYTEAGIFTVASDIPVYSAHVSNLTMTGICCTDETWYDVLENLVLDSQVRAEGVRASRVYCERTFSGQALIDQLGAVVSVPHGSARATS